MNIFKRLGAIALSATLFALLPLAVFSQTKISALPAAATPTGTEVVPVVQSGETLGMTTAQLAQYVATATGLLERINGQIYVAPSGDTSGVTDLADITTAISELAGSTRLPPLASQYYPTAVIILGPGTFYFTSTTLNLLNTSTEKSQGVWLQGSGRGVTSFDYNPATSGPEFINNHGIDVKITNVTFLGHDCNSDFLWSQEQAGVTNVQDYTFEDDEWGGCWQHLNRLTGGNNNSEWKFDRTTVGGSITSWVYTPPQIATTITSGQSTILAANTAEQVESGDTGSFTTACAPVAAGTQVYVLAGASTSQFQVGTAANGSPIQFTASCTPTFQAASDQFLNFGFHDTKFDTGTSPGQWLILNYGGSVKITGFADISKHAPAVAGGCLFNLGSSANNGVHSGGVENFSVEGGRIEIESDNVCVMHSKWWRGSISFNNWDESSQAGNRNIANVYATYEFIQNGGPTVEYRNSQLMGRHNYINNTNNSNYQSEVLYEGVTLYDNPTFANFITMTNNGNTGGYPIIHCRNCRNNLVASTVGYREIVDTDLNWQFSANGVYTTHHTPCVGSNSDWPFTGGSFQIRFPLNAEILSINYSNRNGSGAGGQYDYLFETTDPTPVVLLTVAGTSASTPVPAYTPITNAGTATADFLMTTDTARTIKLIDALSRPSSMTGMQCSVDWIGDLWTPWAAPSNDDQYGVDADRQKAA